MGASQTLIEHQVNGAASLTPGHLTPKSEIFTASTWGINYPQAVVVGRGGFPEEVTCELGFEGLLSDSKGQGSTLRTESAGVMLGTRAVVTAARGQGRSGGERGDTSVPSQSTVSLEVTRRMWPESGEIGL